MAIQFFETVMGKQFYTSTMPRIAKSLETLAKAAEEKPKVQFIVVTTNNFNDDIEIIRRSCPGQPSICMFASRTEAQHLMADDIVAHFNANGWEEDLVPSLQEIQERGYYLFLNDTSGELASANPDIDPDVDIVKWHVLEVK